MFQENALVCVCSYLCLASCARPPIAIAIMVEPTIAALVVVDPLVLSCPVLSCLSCLTLSCLILSCLVLSCLVLSYLYLVLSWLVLSFSQGDEALSDDRIELDNQLHVFEAVMNKDIAEVLYACSIPVWYHTSKRGTEQFVLI